MTTSTRPEDSFRLIEKYGVTHMNMLPLLITYWMESGETRNKYDLSSLKVIRCGGQKVKPELVRWCVEIKLVSVKQTSYVGTRF